jgi:chemotaxis protein methyltransferase CheR
MRQFTQNYIHAKGKADFSSYYTVDGSQARFDPALTEQVVFAQHNLVSDGSFNEFDLVLCRNVMIYFSKPLKDRAHGLFYDSLHTFGVLGLGQKETIKFSPHENRYAPLGPGTKLYRKTG